MKPKNHLQRLLLSLLLLLATSVTASAQEPYAALSATTLTFYYDDLRSTHAKTFDLNTGTNIPAWHEYAEDILVVEFDPAFVYAEPTSLYMWFADMSNLKYFQTIGALRTHNVTNMHATFKGCSSLYSALQLTNWDTRKVTDMGSMFYGCETLSLLNVSSFKTSNVTDMSNMFYNCKSIHTFYGTNFDTSNVTDMSGMFYGCETLRILDLSSWNTGKVTDMNNMFCACYALTTLDVSSFNTSMVTNMNHMFSACTALTNIDVTGFNTSKVTDMGSMFGACRSLTGLNLVNFDTSNVTNMQRMFSGCAVMQSLIYDVARFSTAKVTDMSKMFSECENLRSLNLSRFNTSLVTDMNEMFYNCKQLTTLDLSAFDTDNVTNMSRMFHDCRNLTTISVSSAWSTASVTQSADMFTASTKLKGEQGTTYNANHVEASYARIDGGTSQPGYLTEARVPYAVYTSDNTTLTFYCDGRRSTRSGISYDLNTGNDAPDWQDIASAVTQVAFNPSFTYALPSSTRSWFNSMGSLLTITGIEHLNTEKVTDMSNMFKDCSRLTTLELSTFSTVKVTDMSYMFSGCQNLTSIYVSSLWKTTLVTESTDMFKGCTRLVGGQGTAYNASYVDAAYAHIDGGSANPGYFSDHFEAYAVYTPGNSRLTFMYDDQKDSWGNNAYDLNMGESAPAWQNVAANVSQVVFYSSFANARPTSTYAWFKNMPNLQSIVRMNCLNTENVTTMGDMFNGCTTLRTVDLSAFNTARVTNMSRMFYGCTNLATISAGDGWSTEGVTASSNMFYGCTSLVGGQGTTYNASQLAAAYAHIDGGTGNPGYLSELREAYAVYTEDDTTLRFYCDGQRSSWNEIATTYDLNAGNYTPGWSSIRSSVTHVEFDPSFAGKFPGTTYCWFSQMTNLQSVAGLNYLNTDDVEDMQSMFGYCSSLTSLDLSNFNTEKVTTMNSMFYECSGLTSLDLSNFNTEQVTSMRGMFYNCSGLTSLDISSFNTEQVTDMRGIFSGCRSLTSLDISSFNTVNVDDVMNMFRDCSSLTSLDVSSLNIEKVKYLIDMFYGCSGLTSLDLSGFSTSQVVDMSNMFTNCSSLRTIIIDEGWSTASVTRSPDMFKGCTSLVGGMGTTYDASHVDAAYAHFDGGASNPGYLTVRPKAYACYTSGNTMLTFYYDDQCPLRSEAAGTTTYDLNEGDNDPEWYTDGTYSSVTQVVFDPSFVNARPTTLYRWFYNFSNLQNISNLEYLNTEAATNMSGLFYYCSRLTSLDVSGFITTKVTSMSNMFSGCSGLTSLDVSGFDTRNVINMNSMFARCSGLTSLDVSGFNTTKVTSMSGMFSACSGLTSLDVSGFNTARVTGMSSMFSACSGLTSLDVSGFNTARVTGMSNMFRGCSGLTSLDLSSFNTENVEYMEYMFSDCTGLTRLDLSSFNTAKVRVMASMFRGCAALTRIYAGIDWSTAAVTSSNYMFTDCTRLVGGSGTAYSSGRVDAAFARIDGGTSQPGYLSAGVSAYAVFYNNTLYFIRDNSWNSGPGTIYSLNSGTNRPGWYDNRASVKKVVFNPSFADARPTSTFMWFYGMTQLTNASSQTMIQNIRYLNTSAVTNMIQMFSECTGLRDLDVSGFDTRNVTNMSSMFHNCNKITTLDVSGFDVSNVTNMGNMFSACSSLTTIYCNDDWQAGIGRTYTSMFSGCTKLVGGNGTTYSSLFVGGNYARPDAPGRPGYFTAKFLRGDVNGDGSITIADVTALVNIILGKTQAPASGVADVNGDGSITIADVTALVNIILGK